MKKDLKTIVSEKIHKLELNVEQLEQLGVVEKTNCDHKTKNFLWPIRVVGIFSIIFFAMATYWLTGLMSYKNLPQLVAEEVVMNHLNNRPLEIESDSVAELQGYFNELNFSIQGVPKLAGNYEIEGGRFCSLQGAKAAQIRLQKVKQHYQTLYQVPYSIDLYGELPNQDKGEEPLQLYARGVRVSLWQEKGLLLALTHDK